VPGVRSFLSVDVGTHTLAVRVRKVLDRIGLVRTEKGIDCK